MTREKPLLATVSGSFSKFKPEIDSAIDELTALGVRVLSPAKGWSPSTKILTLESLQFRPLPTELGLSIRQIQDQHLHAIAGSDFLYIVNPNGYLGNSVCMEIGFALSKAIPIFTQFPPALDPELSLGWRNLLQQMPILSISQAVRATKAI
jgi:hypothetical protein